MPPRLSLVIAALALGLPVPAAGQKSADRSALVAYRIVDASAIPKSLTGRPGSAVRGRALYHDPRATGCLGCHGPRDSGAGTGAAGDTGRKAPALAGLARRMTPGKLRLWLVAPAVLKPGTTMPSYYSLGQRTDPMDPRYGETRLTAGEIEDLIAYLLSPRR